MSFRHDGEYIILQIFQHSLLDNCRISVCASEAFLQAPQDTRANSATP